MLKTKGFLLISAIFAICDSAAIIEKIDKKCVAKDSECLSSVYESILLEIADNGLPDLGVPKIDPLELKNFDMNVLGMLKMTMIDGTAKGFKSCSGKKFDIGIETQISTVEYVCELFTIEGDYKIESTPTLLALDGGINVHGEGKGQLVIENVQLNMEFPYTFKKLDDGEFHFQTKPNETTYTFEILGKATVAADNILVGSQEISTVAVNIFNENWKVLSNILGKSIIDKIMEFFHEQVQKFFDSVPVKDLITDDPSTFIKS